MPSTKTITKFIATPAVNRDVNAHYFDGVHADQPTYGEVLLIKVTTTERRADGDVQRLLEETKVEEVIARLDAKTANALAASLSNAAVVSLTPEAPKTFR